MRFIELTGRYAGELVLLNLSNWTSINKSAGGFTSIHFLNSAKIEVKETPKQIADLINKNQEIK